MVNVVAIRPDSGDAQRVSAPLLDTFGRVATDLRVSLTDRCGLRCTYCMPAEGLPWLPREELLSDDELVRLVGVLADLGVRTLRLTGGEPLLRPGLEGLVRRLAGLGVQQAMTTNGVQLAAKAQGLVDAGLNRVNVSLDTLQRERFAQLTRRDRLDDVLAGIAAAQRAGLDPVKVNTVLMRGVNDDETVALVERALEQGWHLRFIEQMPLDPQHGWDRSKMVTGAEILATLAQRWALTPVPGRGSAPAERWFLAGGPASVGVIASVTAPFCAACDRLRLTADGALRTCLFATGETDLRGPLRRGASDADLADLVRLAVLGKTRAHGIGEPGFTQPERPMSAIGG